MGSVLASQRMMMARTASVAVNPVGADGGVRLIICCTTEDGLLIFPEVSVANARTYIKPSGNAASEMFLVTVTDALGGLKLTESAKIQLILSVDISILIWFIAVLSVATTLTGIESRYIPGMGEMDVIIGGILSPMVLVAISSDVLGLL